MDGVLHYSEFIKKKFNIIAIAVSGEDKEKQIISTFYIPILSGVTCLPYENRNFCFLIKNTK